MPRRQICDADAKLSQNLKPLFWDCDFDSLSLAHYRDFIIRRILSEENWEAAKWLRGEIGDAGLRDWSLRKSGRGLDPRQLRFWAVILDLPKDQVDEWVRKARESEWHRRTAPDCPYLPPESQRR